MEEIIRGKFYTIEPGGKITIGHGALVDFMNKIGIESLRFTGKKITENLEEVLDEIEKKYYGLQKLDDATLDKQPV